MKMRFFFALAFVCVLAAICTAQVKLGGNMQVAGTDCFGPSCPVTLVEEFCGGLSIEGTVGSLGWYADSQHADGQSGIKVDSNAAPVADHPCWLTLITDATSGDGSRIYLVGECGDAGSHTTLANTVNDSCAFPSTQGSMPPLAAMTFDTYIIWKMVDTTSMTVFMGFYQFNNTAPCASPWSSTNAQGCGAIGFRYDTVGGDTHYIGEVCQSNAANPATCTTYDTGITPTAGQIVKAYIGSTTAGTILMGLCQAASPSKCDLPTLTAISTNVPTGVIGTPALGLKTRTTAAKAMVLDTWMMRFPVSR